VHGGFCTGDSREVVGGEGDMDRTLRYMCVAMVTTNLDAGGNL
jgi:hypothetical protein